MLVEIAWPGGRQIVESVASAEERVDLSQPGGQPMAGPMGGAPIAQAIVASFHENRDDAILEQGEILGVAADEGEYCTLGLATDSGTQTVAQVIEGRVTDGDDDTGNVLTEPVTCELADGTEWSVHGRIVSAEATPVESVGGEE